MAVIHIIGRDGVAKDLDVVDGGQLMDVLRDADTGVQGTCGGMMSCGTCHVYVDPAWAGRLPAKSEDEAAMLEAIGELVELKATSRLSCQIAVDARIDGLCVEIAPPV